jgi:hypothetical protein
MNGPRNLAIFISQVSDDDLATVSRDDLLGLYEGLAAYAGQPDVDEALARLRPHIWDDETPPPRRWLH